MKKLIAFLLLCFVLFGTLGVVKAVIITGGAVGVAGDSNIIVTADSDTLDGISDDDDDEDENESLVDSEDDDLNDTSDGEDDNSFLISKEDRKDTLKGTSKKEKIESYMEKVKRKKFESMQLKGEDGKIRVVQIEREIINENGVQKIIIKRKIISQGEDIIEEKITIIIKTEDGVVKRKIIREINGKDFEVNTGLDIEDAFGNESELMATMLNGSKVKIKILPDRASEIAREKFKSKNISYELKEVKHKNVPRVVYNIETNKSGKFLGIFKMRVKMDAQVDPETGEIIGESKPWWIFLVSGENSDQTDEEDDVIVNDTTNNAAGIFEENSSDSIIIENQSFS